MVGRPPGELGVSKYMECDTFPFGATALTLLVGWRGRMCPAEKAGCWFVGGNILVGDLHVL